MKYSFINEQKYTTKLSDILFYYDEESDIFYLKDSKTDCKSFSRSFETALRQLMKKRNEMIKKSNNKWKNIINHTTKTRRICKEIK